MNYIISTGDPNAIVKLTTVMPKTISLHPTRTDRADAVRLKLGGTHLLTPPHSPARMKVKIYEREICV